ncbi:MAG: hypothetical protein K0M67_18340 [Thiobacillus sp.]|jgi:hypothetical protein|nr:hypothetical protein [Hydrogenophaga sp.]MBW8470228.1 hypothetical protein [Thiobacillus sp.]
MRHTALTFCLIAAASLLAGCDALGIETAPQVAAKKEAEGMAIGSACRHAIRSIEDCFNGNPKAGKAAVFAGWKDMDQYMRENQIVGMPSEPEAAEPSPGKADEAEATGDPNANAVRSHKS